MKTKQLSKPKQQEYLWACVNEKTGLDHAGSLWASSDTEAHQLAKQKTKLFGKSAELIACERVATVNKALGRSEQAKKPTLKVSHDRRSA